MTVYTQGFREAHHQLEEQTAELRAAARAMPTLSAPVRTARLVRVLDLLRGEVEPHMRLDEQVLYPEIAQRQGALVPGSMSYDHVAIRHWIGELETADPDDVPYLQELLYGLDALIRVHLWKENELYLQALESASWPAG